MLTLVALWVAGSFPTPSRAVPDPACYQFGVFPFLTAIPLETVFAPLAAQLGAELGCPMSYGTAPDFDRFAQLLTQARYDFAFIQPFDYVRFAAPAGYLPLAKVREPIVALFVTRRERGPANLAELRGHRLGLPPPQSAVSLLAQRALLAAGLAPGSGVELVHYRTHDTCLQGLLASEVDCCATARPPLDGFESAHDLSLQRIAASGPLPGPLVVAHERVDEAARKLVRALLLDARYSAEVVAFFKPGFAPAEDSDYEPVRELWRRADALPAGPLAELLFGVYPAAPLPLLEPAIAPLLVVISEVAGVPTRMQTASSRERFAARLEIGSYDLALVDPLDYVRVSRTIGYVPLLRFGPAFAASFYTLRESGLHSLADLRGGRIALPPGRSVLARLARCALRGAGLDPDRDVELVETASHEACLGRVGRDRVVACATDDDLVAWLAPKHELVSIGRSVEVAAPVLVAHPRVPETLLREVRDALLRWAAARSLDVPRTTLGPLIEARDADYDEIRRIETGGCPDDLRPEGGA